MREGWTFSFQWGLCLLCEYHEVKRTSTTKKCSKNGLSVVVVLVYWESVVYLPRISHIWKTGDMYTRCVNGKTNTDWKRAFTQCNSWLSLTQDSRTPLHEAAEEGHKETCEALIVQGAEVNAHDKVRSNVSLPFAVWTFYFLLCITKVTSYQ